MDPKNKANHGVQLLLGRSIRQGDVVYDTQEMDNGRFVSKLTVPPLDEETSYEGDEAGNEKTSQMNAAKKFLQANADDIAKVNEEHQKKKAKKHEEKLAHQAEIRALKERDAADE